jgi:putative transposase
VASWSAATRSGAGVPSSGRATPTSDVDATPRPGVKWHFDEVLVRIDAITDYLWRAVEQHGNVLDVLVQSRRNAKAAMRFFGKLLKGLRYALGGLVTDKLASCGVAHRELMASVIHG